VGSLANRRIAAFALVAGAHAVALAWLLGLTRTHAGSAGAEESLTLVALLPGRPHSPGPSVTPPPDGAKRQRTGAPPTETRMPAPRVPPLPAGLTAIDWAAEAADAASRVPQGEESRGRARTFGMPPASAMFAPAPPRKPGFAWNYARTHRVEALPGGVTVFNLNDHCSIALLWVLPFFGCQLGKIPARGDLFDHLRDPPDPGEH
jgi:hypothetical protein